MFGRDSARLSLPGRPHAGWQRSDGRKPRARPSLPGWSGETRSGPPVIFYGCLRRQVRGGRSQRAPAPTGAATSPDVRLINRLGQSRGTPGPGSSLAVASRMVNPRLLGRLPLSLDPVDASHPPERGRDPAAAMQGASSGQLGSRDRDLPRGRAAQTGRRCRQAHGLRPAWRTSCWLLPQKEQQGSSRRTGLMIGPYAVAAAARRAGAMSCRRTETRCEEPLSSR